MCVQTKNLLQQKEIYSINIWKKKSIQLESESLVQLGKNYKSKKKKKERKKVKKITKDPFLVFVLSLHSFDQSYYFQKTKMPLLS